MQVKKGRQMVLFTISDIIKDPWIGPERLSKADLERLSGYRSNH